MRLHLKHNLQMSKRFKHGTQDNKNARRKPVPDPGLETKATENCEDLEAWT